MSDLQKQEIYDQLYEEYQCISRIPPWFCSKKYANRNQSERSERNDQAALNLASMGTLGDVQEATEILAKNPGNRSQS
jgi:hypothetical protein